MYPPGLEQTLCCASSSNPADEQLRIILCALDIFKQSFQGFPPGQGSQLAAQLLNTDKLIGVVQAVIITRTTLGYGDSGVDAAL